MPSRTGRHRHLAALIAATALALALTPLPDPGRIATFGGPGRAIAADPTAEPTVPPTDPSTTTSPSPDPSAEPSPAPSSEPSPKAAPAPSPSSDPGPSADPGAPASPDPSVTPSPDPGSSAAPDPRTSAAPAPSAPPSPDPAAPTSSDAPSAEPSASPSPEASATPGPTPTPTPYELSPGQQKGRSVGAGLPLYALKAVTRASDAGSSPHDAYSLSGPDCAACHATHTAQAPALANAPAPQSNLCFTCHGGSGSTFNVQAEFTGVPANDPATASYYAHPVTSTSSNHVLGTNDEFGGVLNRHAACADCHDPHDATNARPAQSTTGWTASGDVAGATGVAVVNGAAATAPAYTLVGPGVGSKPLTYEYELCLKCHSGRTVLPAAVANHPSWWALDKGIELNPDNASYHPVEAAGRNLSAQMQASLAGTSPFKAWSLTVDSTVRCTSCHGDPSTVDQTATATPKQPAASAYEASHASPNRGLLIAPYRDRDLKAADEPYDPTDFGLCYTCHAERPFVDPNENPSAPDTNFSLHGLHMTSITSNGVGTSIDTAGAGEGLATCAECHFRVHSTALAYKPGDTAPTARSSGNASLVDFAPDVVAVGATPPTWTQPGATGSGSCTLTCHGFTHVASTTRYTVAPGTGFTAAPTTGPVGTAGLAVQFADATRYASAATATWSWDFGDGTASTAINPAHTYTVAGAYSVTLTVRRTSGGLSTTMTRSAYITVTP